MDAMARSHILGEVVFDVDFASEEEAFSGHTELGGLIQERLLPVIDAVFDELGGGAVYRLDSLELDLGEVAEIGYGGELEQRLRERLRTLLLARLPIAQAAPQPCAVIANEESVELEHFTYFLEHGRMTWNAATPLADRVEALAGRVLGSNRANFVAYLRGTSSSERVLVSRRLVGQFSDDTLCQLAGALAPAHAQLIEQLTEYLRVASSRMPGVSENTLRRVYWTELLALLLEESERGIQPEALVDNLLRGIGICIGKATPPQFSVRDDPAETLSPHSASSLERHPGHTDTPHGRGAHRSEAPLRQFAAALPGLFFHGAHAPAASGPVETPSPVASTGVAGTDILSARGETSVREAAPSLRDSLARALYNGSADVIEDHWRKLLPTPPDWVRGVLKRSCAVWSVRTRLACILPERILREAVGLLAPRAEATVLQWAAHARRFGVSSSSSGSDDIGAEQLYWAFSLAHVALECGEHFHKPEFFASLLQQWVSYSGLTTERVLRDWARAWQAPGADGAARDEAMRWVEDLGHRQETSEPIDASHSEDLILGYQLLDYIRACLHPSGRAGLEAEAFLTVLHELGKRHLPLARQLLWELDSGESFTSSDTPNNIVAMLRALIAEQGSQGADTPPIGSLRGRAGERSATPGRSSRDFADVLERVAGSLESLSSGFPLDVGQIATDIEYLLQRRPDGLAVLFKGITRKRDVLDGVCARLPARMSRRLRLLLESGPACGDSTQLLKLLREQVLLGPNPSIGDVKCHAAKVTDLAAFYQKIIYAFIQGRPLDLEALLCEQTVSTVPEITTGNPPPGLRQPYPGVGTIATEQDSDQQAAKAHGVSPRREPDVPAVPTFAAHKQESDRPVYTDTMSSASAADHEVVQRLDTKVHDGPRVEALIGWVRAGEQGNGLADRVRELLGGPWDVTVDQLTKLRWDTAAAQRLLSGLPKTLARRARLALRSFAAESDAALFGLIRTHLLGGRNADEAAIGDFMRTIEGHSAGLSHPRRLLQQVIQALVQERAVDLTAILAEEDQLRGGRPEGEGALHPLPTVSERAPSLDPLKEAAAQIFDDTGPDLSEKVRVSERESPARALQPPGTVDDLPLATTNTAGTTFATLDQSARASATDAVEEFLLQSLSMSTSAEGRVTDLVNKLEGLLYGPREVWDIFLTRLQRDAGAAHQLFAQLPEALMRRVRLALWSLAAESDVALLALIRAHLLAVPEANESAIGEFMRTIEEHGSRVPHPKWLYQQVVQALVEERPVDVAAMLVADANSEAAPLVDGGERLTLFRTPDPDMSSGVANKTEVMPTSVGVRQSDMFIPGRSAEVVIRNTKGSHVPGSGEPSQTVPVTRADTDKPATDEPVPDVTTVPNEAEHTPPAIESSRPGPRRQMNSQPITETAQEARRAAPKAEANVPGAEVTTPLDKAGRQSDATDESVHESVPEFKARPGTISSSAEPPAAPPTAARDEKMTDLLRGRRGPLEELLAVLQRDAAELDRFILQQPEENLTRLLYRLRGADHAQIQECADLIISAWLSAGLAIGSAGLRLTKWGFILGRWLKQGLRFQIDVFTRYIVLEIAQRASVPDRRMAFISLKRHVTEATTPANQARVTAICEAVEELLLDETSVPSSQLELQAPQNMPNWALLSDEAVAAGEPIYIDNAGLILAAPYMPRLFSILQLADGDRFHTVGAAERAAYLLQYLVDGKKTSPEFRLVLNKLLCGLALDFPIDGQIELGQGECETADSLLHGMLQNWKGLGRTTVEGLRVSFLEREGRLQLKDDTWQLLVSPKPFDMLIDTLPWSIGVIKHPWMERAIHVNWR